MALHSVLTRPESESRPAARPNRARDAWKRYYHYWRLDHHQQPLPWHGRRAWTRVIVTGLVLIAIIAWGFYHTIFAPPSDVTPIDLHDMASSTTR